MAKRALIGKRPYLLASLAAAVVFCALRLINVPGLWLVPVKAAPVALLAIFALLQGVGRDGWALALMMAVAALGDMAMEIDFSAGVLIFFLYHVLAIALYLRHPRKHATGTQKAAAVAMLLLTPLLAWLMPADRSTAWPTALYGLALGGMASSAWMSGFSRYRVGAGAALFLASDLLIIAETGPLMDQTLPDLVVWPLYYVGQMLIAIGVVERLRGRNNAA
jgi:uncharacterized membrane protein YhhN